MKTIVIILRADFRIKYLYLTISFILIYCLENTKEKTCHIVLTGF